MFGDPREDDCVEEVRSVNGGRLAGDGESWCGIVDHLTWSDQTTHGAAARVQGPRAGEVAYRVECDFEPKNVGPRFEQEC